jgi:hypothetical protein
MRLKTAVFVGAVAVAAAPFALAQVTDRYQVASDPEAHGYARSLAVVLVSPPDYVRLSRGRLGNDGTWKGPRYQATLRPSLGADATLDWSVSIEKYAATRASIMKTLVHGWKPVAQGTEPIERRVGGRATGTITATWVLTQADALAGEARYEAGLVFPICGRTVRLWIDALTPSGDSAGGTMGYGEYYVKGSIPPTTWNRDQVLATIKGIALDGNLPAGRVTAARRGGAVAGTIADCNRHPLAGQAIVLQRRSGSAWKSAGTGKTRANGSYSVHARGAGVYRVVAGTRASNSVTFR